MGFWTWIVKLRQVRREAQEAALRQGQAKDLLLEHFLKFNPEITPEEILYRSSIDHEGRIPRAIDLAYKMIVNGIHLPGALNAVSKFMNYPAEKDTYEHCLFNYNSFSQEGEDLILQSYFEGRNTGFYVDVGSYHPYRFSNTAMFYLKGWRGINIDPRPGSKALFDLCRPQDINLEIGISSTAGSLTYYQFEEGALNTTDKARALDVEQNSSFKIKEQVKISVKTLAETLETYGKGQGIDFLSIDVEGLEMDVLLSNDWLKYRPRFVLMETLPEVIVGQDQKTILNTEKFLLERNYKKVAMTPRTSVFRSVDEMRNLL
jgi:FkbM family methyltransferase